MGKIWQLFTHIVHSEHKENKQQQQKVLTDQHYLTMLEFFHQFFVVIKLEFIDFVNQALNVTHTCNTHRPVRETPFRAIPVLSKMTVCYSTVKQRILKHTHICTNTFGKTTATKNRYTISLQHTAKEKWKHLRMIMQNDHETKNKERSKRNVGDHFKTY